MKPLHPISASLTVLAGLVLSGAAMHGDQGRRSPQASTRPAAQVRLTKSDAAAFARDARKGVNVEMPTGVELTLWASEKLITDPVAIDVDPDGTAYVISSSRANLPLDIRGHADWLPIVHTLTTNEALREFYRKDLAPERSAQNTWIPDLNKDGSRDVRDLTELKERIVRIQDTDGDGVADTSRMMIEGFNDDPTWDVGGGVLSTAATCISAWRPASTGCATPTATASSIADDDQRRLQHASGVRRPRHLRRDARSRRPALLGSRRHRLQRRRQDRQALGVSEPGRRAALRARRLELRGVRRGHPEPAGVLVRRARQSDQRRQRRRSPRRERARRLHPDGSDSGWRSNWQYGKYTDPQNNRYNVWMDEALFKPRHDGQAAYILPPVEVLACRAVGHGLQPGHGAVRRVAQLLLRHQLPGLAVERAIYGFR